MVRKQNGLTLIELLIAMVLGLVIMGSVGGVYLAMVGSSRDTLSMSKLNQELATLMTVMTNDIRRAGYWGNATTEPVIDNPFSTTSGTFSTLVVKDAATHTASTVAANSSTGGPCILYTYDADRDGVLDAGEIYGFRLLNGVVEMRQSGNIANTRHDNCATDKDADAANNDTWAAVTDGETITIQTLAFALDQSECLNASEPNEVDDNSSGAVDEAAEYDCYTSVPSSGSGHATVETRQVTITLEGELKQDPSIKSKLVQDVRVRNDLIRIR